MWRRRDATTTGDRERTLPERPTRPGDPCTSASGPSAGRPAARRPILYAPATGEVLHDPDGDGTAAATFLARLAPALTAADLDIV